MKNPPCQSAWRVSEDLICELYQLFSSFLRGASRPKSPRYAVLTATLFMLNLEGFVKVKLLAAICYQQFGHLLRQKEMVQSGPQGTPGRMAS